MHETMQLLWILYKIVFSFILSCSYILIDLTVHFVGDWLGKLFAIASLSPFGILSGFVALILFRRDLHTVSNSFNFP